MFILGLRGQVGFKILVNFHLVVLISGVLLYLLNNTIIEIVICTLFVGAHIVQIRNMMMCRQQIRFSTSFAASMAFPEFRSRARMDVIFHLIFFGLPFFFTISSLLNGDISLQERRLALMFGYYLGNLGLIEILNVILQYNSLRELNDK